MRDAALNWSEAYTAALLKFGFEKGNANPCSFVHVGLDIQTVVHGDDFMSVGPKKSLRKMERDMMNKFKVKSELLRPAGEDGCVQQAKFLNCIITLGAQSLVWEPDTPRSSSGSWDLKVVDPSRYRELRRRAGGQRSSCRRTLKQLWTRWTCSPATGARERTSTR